MMVGISYNILLVFGTLCTWTTHAVPQGDVSDARNKILQDGILSFGNNLLKVLNREYTAPEENTLISPINIYMCLVLAYTGTGQGATRNELATALGLKNLRGQGQNHFVPVSESLSRIIKELENKDKDSHSRTEESIASGIFVQKSFTLSEKYKKFVHQYFSAEIANLDFAQHPSEATDYINKWVSEKTKGLIPKLYPNPIDESTVMVLTSALYFSGQWKYLFPTRKTQIEQFYTGVRNVEVQMMNTLEKIPYINNETLGFEAIKVPYAGEQYHMIIILPDVKQDIDTLVQSFKTADLLAILEDKGKDGLVNGVDYKLPKMKFSWLKSLKGALQRIEVKNIFKASNFNEMTNATNLKVSDVDHATEIEIDEIGTRASAATAVGVQVLSYQPPPTEPKQFHCNRPFMMMLVNRPTKTISFSAVVRQPTE